MRMPKRAKPSLPAVAVLGVCMLLSGCATGVAGSVTAPTDSPGDSGQSTELLTTLRPVTVLDDGSGAELCLGGVAASLPPQCSGPVLVGWDWSAHSGEYEDVSGVRWGEFIVQGRYDPLAGEFTPTDVVAGAGYVSPSAQEHDVTTPCAEPEGGWEIRDAATTTAETMRATFERAAALDGYSSAWMDQSPNPGSSAEPGTDAPDEEWERAMNDPLLSIINVRVTGDRGAAVTALQAVWGGMLCVSEAERTEAELLKITDELFGSTPGILYGGPDGNQDAVAIAVTWDDGALQRQLDDRYGGGVVRVASALVPLE